MERLNQAGIKKLVGIHRGFSTYNKSLYRNSPQWQIPIELKRRIPELTMITDPSHICGNRELLFEVSQKSMDLNFDGVMLEVHNHPDKALSDAKQQITPEALKNLLNKLVLRHPDINNSLIMQTLEDLRLEIDKHDDTLIDILCNRMKIAESIGKYKKDNNITILQSSRWDELLRHRIEKAEGKGLSEEFILKIFRAIHQESINHQTKIMNEEEAVADEKS